MTEEQINKINNHLNLHKKERVSKYDKDKERRRKERYYIKNVEKIKQKAKDRYYNNILEKLRVKRELSFNK